MRRLILVFLLLLGSLPALAADPPSAFIAQLKGPAVAKGPDGIFHPVSLMHLVPGTMVKLPEHTQMQLVFMQDGHHELYTGPGIVGIGRTKGKALQGAEGVTTAAPPALGAALRPQDLTGTPPKPTADTMLTVKLAADGKPTFSWTTSQAGPYILGVTHPPRNLWGTEVATATSVEYAGPALTPDTTYICRLESGGGQQLSSMRFAVASDKMVQNLGAAKAEAMGSDQAVNHALLSEAYEQNGMIDDAVTSAQKAVDMSPQDPGFMRRLSVLLHKTNQEARAKAVEDQERYLEDNFPAVDTGDFDALDWNYLNDTY